MSATINSGVSRWRNACIYHAVSRAVGGAWFLLLGIVMAHSTWASFYAADGELPHSLALTRTVSQAGLTAFNLTLWLLIVFRSAPISRAEGIVASAVALAGTYMPWLITMLPRQNLPEMVTILATGIILTGNVLMLVFVWYLGRSFSLVPQARKLVTAGPYAVIRHPLYLAEEVMIIGVSLFYLSPLTVLLVVVHAAFQVRRMFYEEAVLGWAFPEYAAYKSNTWRVLPGVW